MDSTLWRATGPAAVILLSANSAALAHGWAGQRFFPATILTDDPFVADEMSLPQVSVNPPGTDGARETDIQIDLAKRITPDTDVTVRDQWQRLKPVGLPAVTGLGALQTGAQYQLFVNGPHEALGLVGLNVTWAHTGRVQAPNPNNFTYGFAFEYSLPYLQCCVKDIGLREPFNRLIPLVEVAFSTSLNRGFGGQTTGTIQPGVIWAGQYFQIGAEAILPATRLTGHGYGGVFQFHIYLDDLFPHSIGKPISEWW